MPASTSALASWEESPPVTGDAATPPPRGGRACRVRTPAGTGNAYRSLLKAPQPILWLPVERNARLESQRAESGGLFPLERG